LEWEGSKAVTYASVLGVSIVTIIALVRKINKLSKTIKITKKGRRKI
jgi:hypothetical protein